MNGIKVIGLCGRSGAGKGYVCKVFQRFGIPSIDTDEVYRTLTAAKSGKASPCVVEISELFGKGVIDEDGNLNRRILATVVFESTGSENLVDLNKITHKYIRTETERLIEEYRKTGKSAVIIDAPVLFESGFSDFCDITVFVSADTELSVKRITERDGISEDAARSRLSQQIDNEKLRELCDFEITNNNDDDITSQITDFLRKYEVIE